MTDEATERTASGRFINLRVWVAFGLLSLIWGSSYLFIRIDVKQLAPVSVVFLRLTIGAIVIGAITAIRRIPIGITPRSLGLLAIQGTINTTIPFVLISVGEVTVPSGIAAVLNATTSLFTLIIAAFLLRDERLSTRKAVGAVIGFAGVIVLVGLNPFSKTASAHVGGEGLILLSSVSYAMGAVFVRKVLRGLPSMTVAFWAVVCAATETGILSLRFGNIPWAHLHADTILGFAWLGVFGSGIAYILAYFLISSWGASRMTMVTFVMPVVALLLGSLVLGERLGWQVFAGSVLILGGIVAVSSTVRLRLQRGQADPMVTSA
jgi:drug/metabolite transporter (DMT)-like permease